VESERSRRVDIKAILADPEQRKRLMLGATTFLIGVGEDFKITEAEARFRASALFDTPKENQD